MYSTCLFCHASLGANQIIEHFPVGRRIAYDADQGRLWAVCPQCERWNLSPLEERSEAFDECERAYRDTRKRVSTDNIALARLRDGTDLIRIGQPLRPEFAAWRYERVIRKRRWKRYGGVAIGVAAAVAIMIPHRFAANLYVPFIPLSLGGLGTLSAQLGLSYWSNYELFWRQHMRIPLDAGSLARLTRAQLSMTRYSLADEGILRATVTHGGRRRRLQRALVDEQQTELRGDAAHDVLRRIVVGVNHDGASRSVVRSALRFVESTQEPAARESREMDSTHDGVLHHFMRGLSQYEQRERSPVAHGVVGSMDPPYRIALEMALHEEDERRAMSGELGALYARWEEAERIAKIADGELTRVPHALPD